MPIEKENLAIATNVVRPNYDRIDKYVAELNFTGPVSRGIERLLLAKRKVTPHKKKKIDEDVKALKKHLISVLSNNWQAASVPKDQKDSKSLSIRPSPPPVGVGGKNRP